MDGNLKPVRNNEIMRAITNKIDNDNRKTNRGAQKNRPLFGSPRKIKIQKSDASFQ